MVKHKIFKKLFFITFFLFALGFESIAQLNVTVTTTKNVTCNGGNDGVISVTVTGNTPGAMLSYVWNGGSIDTTATTITISNLVYTASNFVGVTDNSNNTSKAGNYTITQPSGAKFTYPSSFYCKDTPSNPVPTITTNPVVNGIPSNVAGIFTSSPAGLTINSSTGVITIASSTPGVYTVTNTVTGLNGCPDVTQNRTVTINAIPIPTFSYTTPACKIGTTTPTMAAGATKGTFSTSPAGVNFVSTSTGVIDLSATTAGAYTITNTIAASATTGCLAYSATAPLTVVAPGVPTFSYTGSPVCENAGNQNVTYSGGGAAGAFTASPAGLTINSNTGAVTVSSSSVGSYTVTNTIAATASCPQQTATSGFTITALPKAGFAYSAGSFCKSGGGTQTVTMNAGATKGTFSSSPAGLSLNTTTGAVDVSASTIGTYTVTNTIAAGGGCTAQSANTTITITASPVATFNYAGTPYCSSASNPSPTFTGGGSAGSFSANSPNLKFVSTSTGAIDLTTSIAGTYTVTNDIAASGGCSAATASTVVSIQAAVLGTFSYSANP